MKSEMHCEGVEPPKSGRANPHQQAFLLVLRAADSLTGELAELLKETGLSPTQYNVMRILRGAGRDGFPCGKISQRMITRDPDITRLLDRVEKRGLIERWRDEVDRRVVRARITAAGLKTLAKLDEPVKELHRRQLGHLNAGSLKSLSSLLEKIAERGSRT